MRTKEWLNDNWEVAGTRASKLKMNNATFVKDSFEALQKLLNHFVPGSCEQLTGRDDEVTARLLHKFLNSRASEAGLGKTRLNLGTSTFDVLPPTFASSQKSVEALQRFLNSVYSK